MKKLGFLGAGNMAGALVRGLVVTKRYRARDVWTSDAEPKQCRRLGRAYGIGIARDNATLVADSAVVVLAVKPQVMDAVTGLSGSGPAYVYRFAEGLIAGARAEGLPERTARQLAYQTIRGAALMLQETGRSPEELRAMVTSPGGTTLAGLQALEARAFATVVAEGVRAATRRSRELGR